MINFLKNILTKAKKKIAPRSQFPLTQNEGGFYEAISINGHVCCPNCGGQSFNMGPEGGGSQNVQCKDCYKYYNYMGMFGFHEISDRSEVFGTKAPLEYLESPKKFFET